MIGYFGKIMECGRKWIVEKNEHIHILYMNIMIIVLKYTKTVMIKIEDIWNEICEGEKRKV
jgi:hypothetical protein